MKAEFKMFHRADLKALDTIGDCSEIIIVSIKVYLVASNGELLMV